MMTHRFEPRQEPRTAIARLVRARPDCVHRVKARDTTNRWAVYFVYVPPSREGSFLRALEGEGLVDLADYGTVIASGYGETPTPELLAKLKDEFGLTLTA